MANTFISTSKRPNIADIFSAYDQSNQTPNHQDQICILIYCIYIIKNLNGTCRALDISSISKHPEVLILPYSVFRITKRRTIQFSNTQSKRIEIELEEYDESELKIKSQSGLNKCLYSNFFSFLQAILKIRNLLSIKLYEIEFFKSIDLLYSLRS